MTHKIDSLYLCPWRLDDALCQSQTLPYLRGLADSGLRFALITFETEGESQVQSIHPNIIWYPVRWDSGNSLADKIQGILRVLVKGGLVCVRHSPNLIHSRTSLPAFMAVFLKKVFRCKFLYDADSILSEEYADIGHLPAKSKALKFLRWSERWARTNADEIIVLTQVMEEIYRNEFKVEQPVTVVPCCVDTHRFQFDRQARDALREQIGIGDEPLFMYLGKVGSWYLVESTFEFFESFRSSRPGARLLIISTDPATRFVEIADKLGIARDLFYVRNSSYEQVAAWLSAADVGLALIKQVPSKRGSSPVKMAEYLSCGLPVIITDGIGDCTRIINDNRIGIVLSNTSDPDRFRSAVDTLGLLLNDPDSLAVRCRNAAYTEFDLNAVGSERYRSVYRRLLGH